MNRDYLEPETDEPAGAYHVGCDDISRGEPGDFSFSHAVCGLVSRTFGPRKEKKAGKLVGRGPRKTLDFVQGINLSRCHVAMLGRTACQAVPLICHHLRFGSTEEPRLR